MRVQPPDTPQSKITLGPCLYNWSTDVWRDFYFKIADESVVDTVYLGEIVCQKRWPFFEVEFADVVDRLESGGKEVVLSTLTLIMSDQDRSLVKSMACDETRLVEINDLAAFEQLEGRDFVTGPMVNVYNEGTLEFLKNKGAIGACLPAELPLSAIAELSKIEKFSTEVQSFGRVPLAISARCYHARSRGLHKSGCQYVCGEDSNGMLVETLERQPFLAVNGTQTQSHTLFNLIREIRALQLCGVSSFRLYPHTIDMIGVARLFRNVADAELDPDEAFDLLGEISGPVDFSNGFVHAHRGLDLVSASQ